MKLTIKRKKWLRGSPDSYLRHPTNGKMCCLGFYARACGMSSHQITYKPTPESISGRMKLPGLLTKRGTDNRIAVSLMSWNDKLNITEAKREKKITEMFAKVGVKVKFE